MSNIDVQHWSIFQKKILQINLRIPKNLHVICFEGEAFQIRDVLRPKKKRPITRIVISSYMLMDNDGLCSYVSYTNLK